MFKIECLKDYIKNDYNEFIDLATKIYMITEFACDDYIKYKDWYFRKQLPGIFNDERNILFVRNPEKINDVIAMACLKKDNDEQKICTLYVSLKYRNLGIGTLLVEESMKWLGTRKPFITFADYKLDMFRPLIEKYDWQLTEIVSGLYNDKSNELCFNGALKKLNNNSFKEQIQKKIN